LLLGAAYRGLDQGAAQPAFGLRQARIGQQQVSARHVAPAIHVANDTSAAAEYSVILRVGAGSNGSAQLKIATHSGSDSNGWDAADAAQ
jgi:hypothetical protein